MGGMESGFVDGWICAGAGGGVGDGQLVSRGLAWDLASRTRSTA